MSLLVACFQLLERYSRCPGVHNIVFIWQLEVGLIIENTRGCITYVFKTCHFKMSKNHVEQFRKMLKNTDFA